MGGKDRRAGGRCCTPIIKSSHEKIKKLKAKTAPREQLKISTDCLQGSWHKSINLFARLPSDAHDDWTAGSSRDGSRYNGASGRGGKGATCNLANGCNELHLRSATAASFSSWLLPLKKTTRQQRRRRRGGKLHCCKLHRELKLQFA